MRLVRAGLEHLDTLVPLFNGYRQFYGRASDLGGARAFLAERLERGESVIFLALSDSEEGLPPFPPSAKEGNAARPPRLPLSPSAPRRRGKGVADVLTGLGFTQLYPSFSSVSMQRLWILNDLFVAPTARKLGVGQALMERARAFAQETGAKGLTLQTAVDNFPAQALYESLGWKRETEFYAYTLYF